MTTRKSIIGRRFGRYVVIDRLELIGTNRMLFCRCDCGAEKSASYSSLVSGRTKSCGCLRSEKSRETHRKHGHAGYNSNGIRCTPEYKSWTEMKGRCLNINHKSYKDYGGRGITIYQRWVDSFENFIADMGERPSKKHSIDRIDNDGNYEPVNCRWATKQEQNSNTRRNKFVSIDGNCVILAEAARLLGVDPSTVWKRRNKYGTLEAC